MNHFAQMGTPIPDSRSGECTVVHGLTTALEALTECTEAQIDKLKSQTETSNKIINRGRVICIGTFRDDAYVRSLESFFQDSLVQLNKRNFGPDQMPIHQCDLVLVNIYPNAHTSKIKGN
jgi:Cell cycle and development regulator